jgi:6-phosphogluconolactonase
VNPLPFDSPEALALTAAQRWLAELTPDRRQTVALSGGRIARTFFVAVAREARATRSRFTGLHVFWADERCVPPDQAESNFALARTHLLEPLGIPAERVHRIRGEIEPAAAAAEASAELACVTAGGGAGSPILDWVFLGMGEDGHVASLFPASTDSDATSAPAYLAVKGPKPPVQRITLGYPALMAARQVWVMVSGPGKEAALADSLTAHLRRGETLVEACSLEMGLCAGVAARSPGTHTPSLSGGILSPVAETPLARLLRLRGSTLILSDVHPSRTPPKKN